MNMYISRHNISDLYENQLICEMDARIIDYINKHKSKLPFSHIFGNDLRIVIPIYNDPTVSDLMSTLRRIKNYSGVDISKGELIRKVKLDPKHGKGEEKEQRMNIGSAISKLKIDPDDKKRYLDWFAKYKSNLDVALGESKYSIILSRAPIDVVRMSDHDGWTSCHSPNDEYFHCAIQEAITGGAVAYVVLNEDLEEFLDNEDNSLQDDDIFVDNDRDNYNTSLEPLSRLRVRRLVTDDEENEIGIPDIKVYGRTDIPYFYESVKKYLKNAQPNFDVSDFEQYGWNRRGGTYYDDRIKSLIKYYFDSHGNIIQYDHNFNDSSSERDTEYWYKTMRLEGLSDECDKIMREYNRIYSNCVVSTSMDTYLLASAEAKIVFDKAKFPTVDFGSIDVKFDGEDDIKQALDGYYDDEVVWSGFVYFITNNLNRRLSLTDFVFFNNTLYLGISMAGNFDNIVTNYVDFEQFCKNINEFDDFINAKDDDEWYEIFDEIELIPQNNDALDRMVRLFSDDMWYNNERGDRYVEFEFSVDGLSKESFSKYYNESGYDNYPTPDRDLSFVGKTFGNMICSYIRSNYEPTQTEYDAQQRLFEAYYSPTLDSSNRHILYKWDVNDIQISIEANREHFNSKNLFHEPHSVNIIFSVRFLVDKFNEENTDLFLFLDRNLDDLKNMARLAYYKEDRYIQLSKSKYNNLFHNLSRVYGKYMN